MQPILDWITGDTGRVVLTLLFGKAWKMNPKTVTRAFVVIGPLANILVAIAHSLASTRPETQPALFMASGDFVPVGAGVSFGTVLLGAVRDGLLSYLFGSGGQSWLKNGGQWLKDGAGIIKAAVAVLAVACVLVAAPSFAGDAKPGPVSKLFAGTKKSVKTSSLSAGAEVLYRAEDRLVFTGAKPNPLLFLRMELPTPLDLPVHVQLSRFVADHSRDWELRAGVSLKLR